jgi:hypothetical protein
MMIARSFHSAEQNSQTYILVVIAYFYAHLPGFGIAKIIRNPGKQTLLVLCLVELAEMISKQILSYPWSPLFRRNHAHILLSRVRLPVDAIDLAGNLHEVAGNVVQLRALIGLLQHLPSLLLQEANLLGNHG